MPTQVNCCNGSTELSPGEYFQFLNLHAVQCNITSCSPPLVNSSYTVPAAVTPGGSTCDAQVQSNAQPGSYGVSVDCCSGEHTPVIIVKG